jgi:ketosteroid isomerase-like protein
MDDEMDLLKRIYDRFNVRDIDGVLAVLADDVAWANGMDGGHVHGHDAVREYWTRQWAVIDPHVEPVNFQRAADGAIVVGAVASPQIVQSVSHFSETSMTGHEVTHDRPSLPPNPAERCKRR